MHKPTHVRGHECSAPPALSCHISCVRPSPPKSVVLLMIVGGVVTNCVGAALKLSGGRGEGCGGGKGEEKISAPAVSLSLCLCFQRRFRPFAEIGPEMT
jgi:hypothetical protein